MFNVEMFGLMSTRVIRVIKQISAKPIFDYFSNFCDYLFILFYFYDFSISLDHRY
jgi:hypothetical protein